MTGTHLRLAIALGLGQVRSTSLAAQGVAGRRDTVSTFIVGAEETVLASIRYAHHDTTNAMPPHQCVRTRGPCALGRGDQIEIHVSPALQLGNLRLPQGTYGLWIELTSTEAVLVINRDSTPDPSDEVGRVPMAIDSINRPDGPVTFRFRHLRTGPDEIGVMVSKSGSRETHVMKSGVMTSLVIDWNQFRFTVPIAGPETPGHKP